MSLEYYYSFRAEIVLDSTNNVIKFNEGAGTLTATIAPGTYYLLGDGSAADICHALKLALEAAGTRTWTINCPVNIDLTIPSMFVTILISANAQVLWANAGTTFDESLIGFTNVNTALANGYASTLSSRALWAPDQPPSLSLPKFDAKSQQQVMQDGQVRTADFGGPYESRDLEFMEVDGRRVLVEHNAADPNCSYQNFWSYVRDGKSFFVYKHSVSGLSLSAVGASLLLGTDGRYVLDLTGLEKFEPARPEPGQDIYNWTTKLRHYVA